MASLQVAQIARGSRFWTSSPISKLACGGLTNVQPTDRCGVVTAMSEYTFDPPLMLIDNIVVRNLDDAVRFVIGYRKARRPALQTSVLCRLEGAAGETQERTPVKPFLAGRRQSTSSLNSANTSGGEGDYGVGTGSRHDKPASAGWLRGFAQAKGKQPLKAFFVAKRLVQMEQRHAREVSAHVSVAASFLARAH